MQVNPEDSPPEIYVTWSDPRMSDFENGPDPTDLFIQSWKDNIKL